MTQGHHVKKYEIIAEEIASTIQQGLLKRGDKLPSIRQIQALKQVNTATVFRLTICWKHADCWSLRHARVITWPARCARNSY